jgi:hypothetical protein
VICAGTADGKSAAHPCCPKPAGPHQHGSTSSNCVCIDRQAVAPSVSSLSGAEQLIPSARIVPFDSAVSPDRVLRSCESGVFSAQDRFLQFCQLLV